MNQSCRLAELSPEQIAYAATTIGTAIARNFNDDALSVLSSFFFGIGSTLGLIARQRALRESCRPARTKPG